MLQVIVLLAPDVARQLERLVRFVYRLVIECSDKSV